MDDPDHPAAEPEPNLEVAPPVATTRNSDKDGEDVAGPTVKACYDSLDY